MIMIRIETIGVGVLGTNCYLLYKDGADVCIVADPGDDAQKIALVLEKKGLKPEVILLTHSHFDHIGAVADMIRMYPEVRVFAGKNEEPLLLDPELNYTANIRRPAVVEADRFLDDNEEFEAAGIRLTTLFTPGHTAGSVCYYNAGSHILLSGDTLFQGSIGRTDLPTGDHGTIMRSLDILRTLPDETRVYPGHGASTSMGVEKVKNPFLENRY